MSNSNNRFCGQARGGKVVASCNPLCLTGKRSLRDRKSRGFENSEKVSYQRDKPKALVNEASGSERK